MKIIENIYSLLDIKTHIVYFRLRDYYLKQRSSVTIQDEWIRFYLSKLQKRLSKMLWHNLLPDHKYSKELFIWQECIQTLHQVKIVQQILDHQKQTSEILDLFLKRKASIQFSRRARQTKYCHKS